VPQRVTRAFTDHISRALTCLCVRAAEIAVNADDADATRAPAEEVGGKAKVEPTDEQEGEVGDGDAREQEQEDDEDDNDDDTAVGEEGQDEQDEAVDGTSIPPFHRDLCFVDQPYCTIRVCVTCLNAVAKSN
jgi:hypothetical protein